MYGHPNPSFINEVWEQLERIGIGRRNLPWLIMGDFNEILNNTEKRDGKLRSEAIFQDFRRIISVTPVFWKREFFVGTLQKIVSSILFR